MSRPTPSGSERRDGQARQGLSGVIGEVPSGCRESRRRALLHARVGRAPSPSPARAFGAPRVSESPGEGQTVRD